MGGLVFLVCLTLLVGFTQQEFVYAVSEQVSTGSLDNEDLKRSNEQAFSFMQQQLRAYREKLHESERNLEKFQQEHEIISLESQIDLLLQQRNGLDNSLKKAENEVMGFKEKLAWIQGQINTVPLEVPLSTTSREQGIIGSAKSNLLSLQLKEQQLLTKYTEASPHIRAVREEMDVIARFIKEHEAKESESFSRGKNPLYSQMEMELFQTKADLVSAEAQSAVIVQQMAEVDKELERLRRLRPGMDELRRQVKSDESNYLNYLTKVGTTPPQDYQVQVGDELDIKFFFNPELNESVLVRPDGRIALQLVGEISVVGLSVEKIREILIEDYSGQLKNPEVAVLLRSSHVLPGDVNEVTKSTLGRGGQDGN